MATIPTSQSAVQLVGPDELRLNTSKPVFRPGPHQVLAKVEVVGLCFSDLKLLKQFSGHVRKGPVVAGIDPSVLEDVPSYVPNEAATVPGHETVVQIVEVGARRRTAQKSGTATLVQTDYRWLKTASSNAAFGYNFEGALQEYVLMDERVVTAPDGESMLIPGRGATLGLSGGASRTLGLCRRRLCHHRTNHDQARRTDARRRRDGTAQRPAGAPVKEVRQSRSNYVGLQIITSAGTRGRYHPGTR